MFCDQGASKYSYWSLYSDGTVGSLNSVEEFHVAGEKSFVFSKFSSRVVAKTKMVLLGLVMMPMFVFSCQNSTHFVKESIVFKFSNSIFVITCF